MRVLTDQTYRFTDDAGSPFNHGQWPASWISISDVAESSFAAAYRLQVHLDTAATVRVHISADQRYELFVDGMRTGQGPERGDLLHWFYESYDLPLEAGDHVIVARVWTLDQDTSIAPGAQLSLRHGFLLDADEPHRAKFSTGIAPWQAKRLRGYRFRPPTGEGAARFAGGTIEIDGRSFDWGCERGEGDAWADVQIIQKASERINRYGELETWRLRPATLPAMMQDLRTLGQVRHVEAIDRDADPRLHPVNSSNHLAEETGGWQAMFAGQAPVQVPAHTTRRIIIDLEEYYCAYSQLVLSDGQDAIIRLHWAESLYESTDQTSKGQRDQVEGKVFIGRGDRFIADGGPQRRFENLWWNCGRYVELFVQTADEALTIHSVCFRETRYPLAMDSRIELAEPRYDRAVPIMFRTLQMCSHETYMDCPYYEQLMYAGDTRLEILTTYASTRDDRLPRKALRLFDASRMNNSLTQARCPSYLRQIIPQFSLFWVAMVHDYALWRGDRDVVRSLMPGVRSVLETFLSHVRDDGLLVLPEGWNWVDWVEQWYEGSPPSDPTHLSGINQWQFIMVLGHAIALERWMDESALADRLANRRRELIDAAWRTFFIDSRQLFADTPSHESFSEHAQCYALCSDVLKADQQKRLGEALLSSDDLYRTTIYGRFYLFEALRRLERIDVMFDRMKLWYELADLGLKTAVEQPEPSRSDCHAWAAHPIYHGFATVLGIRPADFGFSRVTIAPQLGPLPSASGTMVHPKGNIRVDLERYERGLTGTIALPDGLSGDFHCGDHYQPLEPGNQSIECTTPCP